jgi:chromosome segregation ATPase
MPKFLLSALLALPLAAAAQTTYRCVGKDGKKYYGESVPTACLGQPVEQLNAQGLVVKKIDAQASAAEREKKAAEDAERKKREAISKEEGRRDRALLATYTSEADIDQARARALKDNQASVTDLESKIALLKKKRAEPGANVTTIDIDLKGQESLLSAKKHEGAQINARYDEDKKRYSELTKKAK